MKKIILVIIVLFISFFAIAQDANSEEFDDLDSLFAEAEDIQVEGATTIYRTNKILLKNPRKVTDEMALYYYNISLLILLLDQKMFFLFYLIS